MTTPLKAGDIVWVVFDPVVGSEQSGRRPAIILSDTHYNSLYPRSIVCPITSNLTPWPTKVLLPDGMRTVGAVLADQPRTLHRDGRGFRPIEETPDHILADVRAIVGAILGISG
ncbi:MAG: type II toxin-antitoxin system PemK/MazF family toxin [Pseudaminobacter sp.]